jgi:MFS family permease
MYTWFVFLHVLGAFGFLLAHGASASAAFALRHERNLDRVRALLELSANSYGVMYLSLLVLLVSGIIAGFIGQWWGWGWIWASLALLVAILLAMGGLGSRIYGKARKAVGLPYFENWKTQPPREPASAEQIDGLLAKGNPVLLSVIGYGGFAVITWLMMFKPF